MDRNQFIAALAAPAIALGCVGLNAALAAGVGFDDRAGYTDAVKSLTADEAAAHANAIFARADIDGSGKLDANEYAALAIVTAELSRLNGFYALDIGDGREFVPLPVSAPGALSQAEHARVDAVARAEFYAAAGEDSLMDRQEYVGEQAARFLDADRNGNGMLAKAELTSFAARAAMISRSDA